MKEILQFLTELSCNNNREWFQEHKDWYRDCQQRFEQFTADWLERLVEIDPEIKLIYNHGLKVQDVRRAIRLAKMYKDDIIEIWCRYHDV